MNTTILMESVRKYIPKDAGVQVRFQEKLESLGDEEHSKLSQNIPLLKLKNPSLIFWVGSFLLGNLGVGRFMAGHIGLGVARLCLCVVALAVGMMLGESNFLYAVILIAIWVWWLVDLFIVGKRVRQENLAKILAACNN